VTTIQKQYVDIVAMAQTVSRITRSNRNTSRSEWLRDISVVSVLLVMPRIRFWDMYLRDELPVALPENPCEFAWVNHILATFNNVDETTICVSRVFDSFS
jgi:hypothetical protein